MDIHVKNIFATRTDGAVTDTASGLTWTEQDVADGRVPCSTATDAVDSLNDEELSGLNTWRFPSVDELIALAERIKHSRSQGVDCFAGVESDVFWTNPAGVENPSQAAWFLGLEAGSAPRAQCSNRARVLAVADAAG